MSVPTALLTPITINGLRLRNRVVMAGTAAGPDPKTAEFFRRRASAGLIVTGPAAVCPEANARADSPGIHADDTEAGWRVVAEAVHSAGGAIVLLMCHRGRADQTPHSLALWEIDRTVEQFGRAAERARRVGFDGVEVNASDGCLLDAFLSSRTNRRTDQYGGPLDNRFRFLGRVVDRVLAVWPPLRVGVRVTPNAGGGDGRSPDFRETYLGLAERLDERVLGYLHVVETPAAGESLTLADFRGEFRGRLIGNGGHTRESADAAVGDGSADMIAFDRPYLTNPDLVERFAADLPLADD